MALEIQGVCPLLAVFDMPASIRFYHDLLGFEIFCTSEPEDDGHYDWCWLKLKDSALMLNTAYERSRRPPAPIPPRRRAR